MDFLIETRNFTAYLCLNNEILSFNYLVSPWSSGLVREITFWNWQMEGASSNLSEKPVFSFLFRAGHQFSKQNRTLFIKA